MWAPEKLEKQVRYLEEHPDTGAVFTNAQVVDRDGEPVREASNFTIACFKRRTAPGMNGFAIFLFRETLCAISAS
jgi:hypothetical protein